MKTDKEIQSQVNNVSGTIPLEKIIELRNKNLTYKQIGELLGCSDANICKRLAPFRESLDNLGSFKENRADLLAVYQREILKQLTPDHIKKARLTEITTAFGTLYDKERLERGQSTENIAYADLSKTREAIAKRIEAFELEHGVKHETPVSSNE